MTVFSTGDSVSAVVADIGSYASKIGFAGEDYPRAYFRSNVAVQRDDDTENAKTRRRRRPIDKVSYDFLNDTLNKDDDENWEVKNPVDSVSGLWNDADPHTNQADWADLIPKFLNHGYESSLGLQDLRASPLMMVERSYNPPPIRQQMLEILMEECQVPATF
eukprot:CAMPEP_0117076402 /NCGR_PEP_ID=MMETSP0472-20121206/53845_1 /TAXON_ID=693140 ORGANISM="Tiarina fusus, Strain LIS" /NCGR_SAMPLE_ID=MMETSP0472 /ASSEMBLY_ACC=CAM_ASM_000603 /LENGTH=161 /DNA_ID=CAMNT_0004802261 /DNA_START=23 /DNA_END=505 /DNA_ORIENTATION=+